MSSSPDENGFLYEAPGPSGSPPDEDDNVLGGFQEDEDDEDEDEAGVFEMRQRVMQLREQDSPERRPWDCEEDEELTTENQRLRAQIAHFEGKNRVLEHHSDIMRRYYISLTDTVASLTKEYQEEKELCEKQKKVIWDLTRALERAQQRNPQGGLAVRGRIRKIAAATASLKKSLAGMRETVRENQRRLKEDVKTAREALTGCSQSCGWFPTCEEGTADRSGSGSAQGEPEDGSLLSLVAEGLCTEGGCAGAGFGPLALTAAASAAVLCYFCKK